MFIESNGIIYLKNPDGTRGLIIGEIPMSGTDPVGEFVVSGAILGKPLLLLGKGIKTAATPLINKLNYNLAGAWDKLAIKFDKKYLGTLLDYLRKKNATSNYLGEGFESVVLRDGDDVVKISTPFRLHDGDNYIGRRYQLKPKVKSKLKGNEYPEFIPHTEYEGYVYDGASYKPVFRLKYYPYNQDPLIVNDLNIQAVLKQQGFRPHSGLGVNTIFTDGKHQIYDIKPDNWILSPDNKLLFMDPIFNKQGGSMNYLDFFKKGGIHIKPENRGKFTETKKRTGKTTEELTHSKNPLTRKRAIFALNAKKWHHGK